MAPEAEKGAAAGMPQTPQCPAEFTVSAYTVQQPSPNWAMGSGWSIIPVGLDKRPLITSWKRYQYAQADDEVFGRWLDMNPSAWAAITGEVSGLVILDFDGAKGTETMRKLGVRPHVRTGSGGYHLYLKHPGWHVPTLNSKTKKALGEKWPGLDIRGDGGYAVFAGRNHVGEYRWLRHCQPDEIYELDIELRQMLGLVEPEPTAPVRPVKPARSAGDTRVDTTVLVERAVQRIASDGRNNAGFWLATQLRDNGYTEGDARATMRSYVDRVPPTNTKGHREAYTISEANASVREAYSAPARDPWTPKRQAVRGTSTPIREATKTPITDNDSANWRELLIQKKPTLAQQAKGETGTPLANLANAVIALTHAPEWAGCMAFDEFAGKVVVVKETPFGKRPGPWEDNDTSRTTCWLQQNGLNVNSKISGEAVQTVAMDHRFHPVRDYLNGLKWDGIPRIHKWIREYLGGNNAIHCMFGQMWLISGAARILYPGAKVDTALVLESGQGDKKSTVLESLVPRKEWFADRISDFGTKDSLQECNGIWIVEIAEFDSHIRGRDAGKVKAFMSSATNRFRLPYGHMVMEFPRQCIFAGTTNKTDYLQDETGGRRFWPIPCGNIDADGVAAVRDQLWAEAVVEYRKGTPWWITDADVAAASLEQQEARYEPGPWDDIIAPWLQGKDDVSVSEIMMDCLGRTKGAWTQRESNIVAKALVHWKWKQHRVGKAGVRRYQKGLTV
jgi:predicted P-loop ATPase